MNEVNEAYIAFHYEDEASFRLSDHRYKSTLKALMSSVRRPSGGYV